MLLNSDASSLGVEEAISSIRKRLLDLSGKNKLINFRHTKRSIRVVDEYPDFLCARLLDGERLFLQPLPEPETRPPELEAGDSTTESVEFGDQVAGPHQGSPTVRDPSSSGLRNGDQAARPTSKPVRADPITHARNVGVNPELELPLTAVSEGIGSKPEHRDNRIQTLWYAEELEAIAGAYSRQANLLLQETGANMLQLVFGFLEWKDRSSDFETRLSPLLLLPIEMTKGHMDPRTRTFRYSIAWSGEDLMVNVSLQEKLRQDGIELPQFAPDRHSWADWINLLPPLLAERPDCRIRGYVTLAILQFGKILLWKDLDKENWPNGVGPNQHKLVRELFEGRAGDSPLLAGDEDIDARRTAAVLPPLIYDANTSQHSALIDALQGKNLVIQGPPGTGKSQTITNLIAAALARGWKVLFVAEKAAALSVVHKRLKAAKIRLRPSGETGLDAFCLELHSTRSRKREVLDHWRCPSER